MADQSITRMYEDLRAAATRDLPDMAQEIRALYGPCPMGFVAGSTEEQLEAFVVMRDDPAAWEGWIAAEQTRLSGFGVALPQARAAAEATAVREFGRLEGLLTDIGGVEALAARLMTRYEHRVHQAVTKAEKAAALPEAEVLPPLPPGALDLVARLTGQPPGTTGGPAQAAIAPEAGELTGPLTGPALLPSMPQPWTDGAGMPPALPAEMSGLGMEAA